jgi:hypothetical protein
MASVLLAVATGDSGRARDIIANTDELDDDARAVLADAVAQDASGSSLAQALGDALRSLGAERHLVNECYRTAFYGGDGWAELSGNPLFAFFLANKGGSPLDKWVHYFPIYERHLAVYRGRPIRVLEIGVYRGGGLKLLSHYLGPQARLVGIDIDRAARLAARPMHVEIGDQADADFLKAVSDKHGPFDVIVDDGGHTMRQQVVSVETLFPLMADGGTYIVEDCHTSYWPEYSDQPPGDPTFLEWSKARMDDLHAYHFSTSRDLQRPWQTDLVGLHVYDSVVVLDKAHRAPPFCELSGTKEFITQDRLSGARELEVLASRDAALARIEEVETRAVEVEAEALRTEASRAELEDLRKQSAKSKQTESDLLGSWGMIREMRRSKSWQLTAPLRRVKSIFRRS